MFPQDHRKHMMSMKTSHFRLENMKFVAGNGTLCACTGIYAAKSYVCLIYDLMRKNAWWEESPLFSKAMIICLRMEERPKVLNGRWRQTFRIKFRMNNSSSPILRKEAIKSVPFLTLLTGESFCVIRAVFIYVWMTHRILYRKIALI